MDIRRRIVLVGRGGTGKGAAAKIVARKLGIKECRSAGDFFHSVAKRRGVTKAELEQIAANDFSVDTEVDKYVADFASSTIEFVIDSRRGHLVIDDAVSILLVCNHKTRFDRIADRDGLSYDEARLATNERELATSIRYQKLYGKTLCETLAREQFGERIIDTTDINEKQVAKKIIELLPESVLAQ